MCEWLSSLKMKYDLSFIFNNFPIIKVYVQQQNKFEVDLLADKRFLSFIMNGSMSSDVKVLIRILI